MLYAKIISFFVWAAVTLWSSTLKVRLVNTASPDRPAGEGGNAIYAFWHDSVFLLPHSHRNSKIRIVVSESRDGEIAARTLRRFGFSVVRGSSKRKGTRALMGLLSSMRNGTPVAITVDGPRGPRHSAKAGAVYLGGKLQVPIVPVATWAKRCWVLGKTWDRFIVPAPFTEGAVLYGAPITVNGTSREEIEAKCRELESVLCRMTREAADTGGTVLLH